MQGATLYHSKGDICFRFLWLAVLFCPLRAYGLFKIGPYIISGFKVFALLMVLFAFLKLWSREYVIPLNRGLLKLLLIIVGYDILSLSYSSSYGLFGSYLVSHIILFFSFVIVINNVGKTKALVNAFVLSSIIPIIIGIYQWIGVMRTGTTPKLPLSQFVMEGGKDELFLYNNYRVVSTLQDPSYLGLFLASVILIIVGYFVTSKLKFRKWIKVVYGSILLLALVCLFMTGSISSIVNMIIGLISMILFTKKDTSKFIKLVIGGIFVILISLLFFSLLFDYNPVDVFTEKLETQGSEGNLFGREKLMSTAIEDWGKSVIWGVGFGNMTYSSAHNSYLTILAIQGIIGFLLNFCLIIGFLIRNFNVIFRFHIYPIYSIACGMALTGMIIQLMAYDCLYKMDPTIVILVLLFSAVEENKNKLKFVHKIK